jgi:hypothetical protein
MFLSLKLECASGGRVWDGNSFVLLTVKKRCTVLVAAAVDRLLLEVECSANFGEKGRHVRPSRAGLLPAASRWR